MVPYDEVMSLDACTAGHGSELDDEDSADDDGSDDEKIEEVTLDILDGKVDDMTEDDGEREEDELDIDDEPITTDDDELASVPPNDTCAECLVWNCANASVLISIVTIVTVMSVMYTSETTNGNALTSAHRVIIFSHPIHFPFAHKTFCFILNTTTNLVKRRATHV